MRHNHLILLLLIGLNASGQKSNSNESFYLWTKDWKPTQENDKAAYFARLTRINDTSWKWNVYNYMGPMISCQYFKDSDFKQAKGIHTFYHSSGYIDSLGTMENNHLQGDWNYYNDSGRLIFQKKFDEGKLVFSRDVLKDPNPADTGENKLKPGEIESSFRGGDRGWQRYLLKNLKYPDRAYKANIMGEVIAEFIVDANGHVETAALRKSVEFSLDEETLELILKSPDWVPATQDGHHVKSYKVQPLRYRF